MGSSTAHIYKVLGESRYNESYVCYVLRVEEIREGVIEVDFDSYGDGSSGPLPNPLESILGMSKAESVSIEVEDVNMHVKGTLVFRMFNKSSKYIAPFIFGSCGYSAVELHIKPAPPASIQAFLKNF